MPHCWKSHVTAQIAKAIGMLLIIYFIVLSLMAILYGRAEPFVQFSEGHYEGHWCEFFFEFVPVVQVSLGP